MFPGLVIVVEHAESDDEQAEHCGHEQPHDDYCCHG